MGKFEFPKLSRDDILEGMRAVWKPLLKFVPRVILLANRWIIFQFLSEEDRMVIESQFLAIGHGSLVLERWHVGFDPLMSSLSKRHLWVILLNFLVHCWNLKGFMSVVNSLGRFILMEDEQLLGFERVSPMVLVEMEVDECFPAELEVIWDMNSFIHRLDYWSILF